MKRRFHSIRTAAMILALLSTRAVAQDHPPSHRDLDWQAPNRWVHVDNLDAGKAPLFENARKGWLAVLRTDEGLLGDGRALFWQARTSAAGQTFFSFYPFRDWSDLDARRAMVVRTQGIVGDDAVKSYDSGDAALVSPHYSQIWRRSGDFDIAAPAALLLDELTAGVGRLEVHTVDITRWDAFEQAWRQVADALVTRDYPLACRAYSSSYGKAEFMVWWLAPDAASYRDAQPIPAALAEQLGQRQSAELLAVLDEVFPLQESYEVDRRADLSNLGR
jgi:hypothetical protein